MTEPHEISELLQQFQECDLNLNQQVSDRLLRLDSEAVVTGLLQLLQTPDLPPFVYKQAVKLLGQLNTDAVPALVYALNHADVAVCRLAAENLGAFEGRPNWNQESIVPALMQALNYPDAQVLQLAAESLGRFGIRLAIPEIGLLLSHSDEVRDAFKQSFKQALTRQGRSATPNLLEALRHPNSEVRTLAAEGLEYLATEAEIPDLQTALQDPVASVRTAVEAALNRIRDPQPELLAAARHYLGFWNYYRKNEGQFIATMRSKGFVNQSEAELRDVFQQVTDLIETPCSNDALLQSAKWHVMRSMGRSYDEADYITDMRKQGFGNESETELLRAYLQAHQTAQNTF